MKLKLFSCAIVLACMSSVQAINGDLAAQGEFPYVGSVRLPNFPVGAADEIHLGSVKLPYYTHIVATKITHPDYNYPLYNANLLQVTTPFDLSDPARVSPAILPDASFTVPLGSQGFIAAYGADPNDQQDENMRKVQVTVVDNSECGYSGESLLLCAKAAVGGACSWDLGAPLTVNGIVVGFSTSEGCQGTPFLLVATAPLVDWINSNVN
ncbi:chymotrypsin-2-like isoform X2 [Neocloeon triangulifer]|uniref:chymotrypsin-2-like isoform X2 n=1 Tax=Neocloeon triangulifer TaxID=2078957 RepID=UPI00286F35F4|nr:chymotrypsin-2-like isoform X2 [Neocloeon triangulifer]